MSDLIAAPAGTFLCHAFLFEHEIKVEQTPVLAFLWTGDALLPLGVTPEHVEPAVGVRALSFVNPYSASSAPLIVALDTPWSGTWHAWYADILEPILKGPGSNNPEVKASATPALDKLKEGLKPGLYIDDKAEPLLIGEVPVNGDVACRRGFGIIDNPYPEDTHEIAREQWEGAWRQAHRDMDAEDKARAKKEAKAAAKAELEEPAAKPARKPRAPRQPGGTPVAEDDVV